MATMKSDIKVQEDGLLNEVRVCYNREVECMREIEFPMLQGYTQYRTASITEIDEMSRHDLP